MTPSLLNIHVWILCMSFQCYYKRQVTRPEHVGFVSYFECVSLHASMKCCSPVRCCVGPGHTSSQCQVFPVPPGPHTTWAPDPGLSSLLHLGSVLVPTGPLETVHCPVSLSPSLCLWLPSLHHSSPLHPRIPAGGPEPAPTGSPRNPGPRSPGDSEGQGRAWSGCPMSSGCPGRRRRRRWSRS